MHARHGVLLRWHSMVGCMCAHIRRPAHCITRPHIHHHPREMLRNKRHTEVYPGSCIGDGTIISPTAHVSHSVIGRHCHIKDGAVLRNAYLMDGAVVEEGARVSYSILCSGAVVKAGGQVSRGCMLGQGCVRRGAHVATWCACPVYTCAYLLDCYTAHTSTHMTENHTHAPDDSTA